MRYAHEIRAGANAQKKSRKNEYSKASEKRIKHFSGSAPILLCNNRLFIFFLRFGVANLKRMKKIKKNPG